MAIRALLFDKDGTLLDFEATWTPLLRRMTLDLAGGDPVRARDMLIEGGYDELSGRMRAGSVLAAGTTDQMVRLWFPELHGDDFRAMAARLDTEFHAGASQSIPLAGTADALAALEASGYRMGVATNDATQAAKAGLAVLGLDRYLPFVFGYDSVPNPKPAADIVIAFADAVGMSPAEIAVVGDNRHDIEMARNAGAGAAIGVLTGNSGHADLWPHADAVLGSIADLPAWLRTRNSAAPSAAPRPERR
jgi:phosphoglycolate phosphatase